MIKELPPAEVKVEEVKVEADAEAEAGAVVMASQETDSTGEPSLDNKLQHLLDEMKAEVGDEQLEKNEQKKNRPAQREKMPAKKFEPIDEQETDDESVRSNTIFFEICRIFLGILKNGESSNLKVKHIALYKLFPKLVNISLPFIGSEHSDLFMRILVRGCKIEWGSDTDKIKHFNPHLRLAADLVKSGGLKFSDSSLVGEPLNNFKRVLVTFKRCYIDVSEVMKREILKM